MIKSFEGYSLKAYPDPATGGAPWTIGWGHTGPGVAEGLVITANEAEGYFRADLLRFCQAVQTLAPTCTDNQFAALVSFAYNEGPGRLKGSTLLALHNRGDYAGAAKEFGKWVYADGRVPPGLVTRRAAEARLYSKA
ncbi:MAG: lysozyme [Elusimicrobia bacterium]|nr:lysozyme [Elusimicrobiota bacterium]